MKTFKAYIAERCWPGYKETPGKTAYSKGSCVKEEEQPKDYPGEKGHMWHPTGKTGTHMASGKKTYEYAEVDKEGKRTGARHYKDIQGKHMGEDVELDEDWQKVNKSDRTDGLSQKAVDAYRRENPGSKLQTAVTTKPSKLKPGSKSAKRRLSFCRRMKGMKEKLTSAETARDPDSRINKSLRKWNC